MSYARRLRCFAIVSLVLSVIVLSILRSGIVSEANTETPALVPVISASKSVAVVVGNADANADPGETLEYTVTINNTGPDPATGVAITDTLQNITTLVAGSTIASPVAVNDTFSSIGNVGISVPDGASDLLINDLDANNPGSGAALVITSAPTTSAQGGNVSVNTTTGAFTYNPAPGFEGADSFSYTLSNGTGLTDTATVTINVSGMIWFINNNAAACTTLAGGCGRLSNPLSSLAAFQALNNGAGNNPAANDNIFIFESATGYSGGVTLLSGQKLIGQDATATLVTISGVTVPPFSSPALPAMNSGVSATSIQNGAGNAVTLNQGNTIRGLTISGTSGAGVIGSAIANLTIGSDVITTGITGNDLDLSGAATGTVTFGATVTNTAGRSISVQNRSGGAVDLTGPISDTGTGILVNSNTGATINFTGGISVSTGANAAFTATGGGTVNVTGTNTVTTTSGTAVNITGTIGASNVTFQSVAHNGNNSAIILSNTGTGTFSVTGTGTTAGTGGTIENIVGSDAISLNNTDGRVTLRNMIIEDITAAGDATATPDTRSLVDAIHGQLVDGGLTLDGVTIRRISDSAVNGTTFGNLLGITSWNGLIINNSTLENANRFNVANRGDAEEEGLVRILGITGTVSVTNTTLQNGARGLHFESPPTGNIDITVQNTDFLQLNKEFIGLPQNRVGYWGFNLFMRGSANAVVRIGDPAETNPALGCTFLNNPIASINIQHFDGTATGTIQTVVAQNIFTVTDHLSPDEQATNGVFDANFPQGGVLFGAWGGTMEAIFAANTFRDAMHGNGGVGNLNLINSAGSDSEYIVRNNTFDGPWDFIAEIRADGNTSSAMLWQNNIMPFKNLGPAEIAGTELADIGLTSQPLPFEPFFVDVRNGGRLDLTIQNETIPDHDRVAASTQRSFFMRTQASGGMLNLEMDSNKATNGYRFDQGGASTFNLFRDGSASGTVQGVLQANGNRGGNVNPNLDPPVVQTNGTITLSNTDPVLPSITIPLLSIPDPADEGVPIQTASTFENKSNFLNTPLTNPQFSRHKTASAKAGGMRSADFANPYANVARPEEVVATAEEFSANAEVFVATQKESFAKTEGIVAKPYADVAEQRVDVTKVPAVVAKAPALLAILSSAATKLGEMISPTATAQEAKGQTLAPESGETVTKSLGTLPGGESIVVKFRATVDNGPFASGVNNITNTATISGSNFANVSTNTTSIALDAAPDLSVTKTDGGGTTQPGMAVVYTLNYSNITSVNGQNAVGVQLSETVPTNTTFNAAASLPSVWSCPNGSVGGTVCTLNVGAVNAGAGSSATFGINVLAALPAGVIQISNSSTVAESPNTNGTDPIPANNTGSDTTNIIGNWLGATNTDWYVAANWSNGVVPPVGNNVSIPTSGNIPTVTSVDVTLNNLVLNGQNASIGAGRTITVNSSVVLGANTVSGLGTLSLAAAASISRTTGQVNSTLQKNFGGTGAFTFPVGTTGQYSPVDVNVTAGSGQLTVRANTGLAPATPTPLNAATTLQRYWTLNGSGITSDITFNYLQTDVAGNEAAYNIIRVPNAGSPVTRFVPNGSTRILNTAANFFGLSGVQVYSHWTVGEPLAPTASNVVVSGRVRDRDGRGVPNGRVTMISQDGNLVYATTNPFGYYRFVSVQAGQTYVVSVGSKRHVFASRVVSVGEDVAELDFIAEPEE